MEHTYAIVESGSVSNVVVWSGDSETWQPPDGASAVPIPDGVFVDIGYLYDGSSFSAPTP